MNNRPTNLATVESLTVPTDHDAETAFIGSLLAAPDAVSRRRIRGMADPAWFTDGACSEAFTVAARLVDRDRPVTLPSLTIAMREAGTLEDVGGSAWLAEVAGTVFTHLDAEHYAERIRTLYLRRRGLTEAVRLARDLASPGDDEHADARIQRAISDLWAAMASRTKVRAAKLEDWLHAFIDQREAGMSPALTSGCFPLDKYTGVFAYGKYTIIGGRPSMGKSTACRWLLGEWARAGTPVGLVACEEDRTKIAGNYISSASGIDNDHIAYGSLNSADWQGMTQSVGELASWPWYGIDTAFTLGEVSTAVELLATEHRCKVIAVDHLHLIRLDKKAAENEHAKVTEISARLKELAKRYGVVLIAAAQLSRPVKSAGIPPPPTLTDLRASGSIEEHADAVVLLHREDYYRPKEAPNHMCDWIVAKNRNGARGVAVLKADLKHQRYEEPGAGVFDDHNVP